MNVTNFQDYMVEQVIAHLSRQYIILELKQSPYIYERPTPRVLPGMYKCDIDAVDALIKYIQDKHRKNIDFWCYAPEIFLTSIFGCAEN